MGWNTGSLGRAAALLAVVVFWMVPASCTAGSAPPAAVTAAVHTSARRQRFLGTGGDYAQGRFAGTGYVDDNPGVYNLAHLRPAWVRVGLPMRGWAPVPGGYVDAGGVHNVFLLMQELSRHGAHIILSLWDVPDWMTTAQTRTRRNQRVVDPAHWNDCLDGIEAFLVRARDLYGVKITYLSWNEADGGYSVLFSAADQARFIARSGPRLAALGLDVKWLVGDSSNTRSFLSYAPPILQSREARPYLGPCSFHSWDDPDDALLRQVVDLASRYHKELFCPEVGHDPGQYRRPESFTTWENAWEYARLYHRLLTAGRVVVTCYWEYQQDFPLESGDSPTAPANLYPAYFVEKQLADNLRPGTTLVDAVSSDPNVLALAATGSRRGFMTQALNLATAGSTRVTFTGLPDEPLRLERTSQTENEAVIGTYTPVHGVLTLDLPAESITTLTTYAPAP